MADAMVDCTEPMLERWDRVAARGETIDLVDEMMALTQAIIVRTMFSTDLGADRRDRQPHLADHQPPHRRDVLGDEAGDALPLPANRRFRRALRELDAVVYRIIAERRQTRTRRGRPAVDVAVGARRGDRRAA